MDGAREDPPVYYGGPDRWILVDRNADPEEHARALLHHLADDGITDLGLAWAEYLTVERAATLLARDARPLSGSLMEGWLPAYARAARAHAG